MEDKIYIYGGYHFQPFRKFSNNELKNIKGMDIDTDMPLCRKNKNYDYYEFLKAMNNSDKDIFTCVENGKDYVPCDDRLLRYHI